MRLSIATKVVAAIATVTLAFTLVLITSSSRTRRLQAQIQALNRSVDPIALLLSDAQADLRGLDGVLSEVDAPSLAGSLGLARILSIAPRRIGAKLARAARIARRGARAEFPTEERRRLDSIARSIAALGASIERLDEGAARLERAARATEPTSLEGQRARLRQATRALERRVVGARNELRVSRDVALLRINREERDNFIWLAVSSAVAIVVAALMLLVALAAVRPLAELGAAARRVAAGDYAPIPAPRRGRPARDEIGALWREFDAMAAALKERDEALSEQQEALLRAERLAIIGRMTALITHELRNPLSSIGLHAEVLIATLEESGHADSESRHTAEALLSEVDRLRDITEEYLMYARPPAPDPGPLDLREQLEDVLDFYALEWAERGIRAELAAPDGPLLTLADAHQLRQAWVNLLRNAVEASPDGRPVRVAIARAGAHLEVRIEDRGPGVAPELRGAIFEPFATTKPGGTGLGLAMAAQIVEDHGGRLRVEPREGGGARFVAELRALAAAAAPDPPQEIEAPRAEERR